MVATNRKIFPWVLLMISCVMIAAFAVMWSRVWSVTTIEVPENYGTIRAVDHPRVSNWTEPANNPNEDRSIAVELTDGSLFAGVFDGHGGFDVSDQASALFTLEALDLEDLDKARREGDATMTKMFATIERQVEKTQRAKHHQNGSSKNGRDLRIGSCALVAWLTKNNLILAYTGDSLAFFFPDEPDADHPEAQQLNEFVHNIAYGYEQAKLQSRFPHEKPEDLFKCRGVAMTHCYMRGRLQLTRALGDLGLEPYVTHEPDVIKHTFTRSGYLVLASDGFWDEFPRDQRLVADLLRKMHSTKVTMGEKARNLVKLAYAVAAARIGVTAKGLEIETPSWMKRRHIDDITVVVMRVDLDSPDEVPKKPEEAADPAST